VFPLGMYSAASSALALVVVGPGTTGWDGLATSALPAVLRAVGHGAFGVALVVWGAVAIGLVRTSARRR